MSNLELLSIRWATLLFQQCTKKSWAIEDPSDIRLRTHLSPNNGLSFSSLNDHQVWSFYSIVPQLHPGGRTGLSWTSLGGMCNKAILSVNSWGEFPVYECVTGHVYDWNQKHHGKGHSSEQKIVIQICPSKQNHQHLLCGHQFHLLLNLKKEVSII